MDLSVVIPCLNESETIGICIKKAKYQIKKLKLKGEIIISDNGSTDGSEKIARKLGAKVFNCKIKGYGSAVINGIKKSKGKFIIIADADNSYNLNDIPKFYKKIQDGYDLIQGCRLPKGGGKIKKGAMPISHRIIGNPFFSKLVKVFYNLKFNDVYCGMKILRRKFFKKANFFSQGMVFCLEILIKSKVMGAKVDEIPITLFKDGRVNSKSHLNTIKDGLKTLKFILISSPKWLLFFPSIVFFLIFIFILLTPKGFIGISVQNKIILLFLSYFLSFQMFMLGLFSSLRSQILGLGKNLWLNNFFNFFSLKLAFSISFILFLVPIFYKVLDYSFLPNNIDFILTIFIYFFCLSLLGNSLTISLLSLKK